MKIYKNFHQFYPFFSQTYSKLIFFQIQQSLSSNNFKGLNFSSIYSYNIENSTIRNSNISKISTPFVIQEADRLIIYIKATFNNTLLTLTNEQGQVLTWASAGSCGFKGARKGTPFAAKKVVETFIKKSTDYLSKCKQIKICVYGVGPGRENALRGLEKIGYINPTTKKEKKNTRGNISTNVNITSKRLPTFKLSNKITLIREITKIPHNGCRPPKKRRL